jgi:hypothetical protein
LGEDGFPAFPIFLAFLLPLVLSADPAPPPWSSASYPDEAGYQRRTEGMLSRIAAQDYLSRAMSVSTCPDTGRKVFTWALEGESILSPFTGRRYTQGPNGYFGAKKRDAEGRISAFGGDPLKYNLPPATAALMLAKAKAGKGEPSSASAAEAAKAYLAIPGNLRQHYHFAAVNWCRLLPLAGDQLPPAWHEAFRAAVASYEENRKPSDGVIREYQPLPRTENLIGRAEELLGGGGTENHKTMWRSSGLLYAQTFPAGSKISGFSLADAEKQTSTLLTDYARKLFTLGNGEYDSSTYYPYSFRAWVNLHDFSPKPATRAWAKAALDYYFATYGLKVFNGLHTGPQRRGWVEGDSFAQMEAHLWVWAGGQPGYTTVPVDPSKLITSLHQATSSYRPDCLLTALISKQVPLPFEARLNHPDYGMTTPGMQPEYFYCSNSFALGSVQMDGVNNSAQQTTWSLNVRGPRGSLIISGGQPRWLAPEGHSPYDQWVQHRGALLLMTAPTSGPCNAEPYALGKLEGPKGYSRATAFAGPLSPAAPPAATDEKSLAAYYEAARNQAATWLYLPREAKQHALPGGRLVLETTEAFVVITPFGGTPFWLEGNLPGAPKALEAYSVLAIPMSPAAGFAIEAVERTQFPTLSKLAGGRVSLEGSTATYHSLTGDTLELAYQPAALRPLAKVNGAALDWTRWANGAVVDSPYLKIKDGRLWLSDTHEAYELDTTREVPVWAASSMPTTQMSSAKAALSSMERKARMSPSAPSIIPPMGSPTRAFIASSNLAGP